MLHIKDYNKTTIINNDIEEIIIDELNYPLDNINPMVNKITVKRSFNIHKRQNRIPYGCAFIIENITINDINVFNNMKEEDYPDITLLVLSDEEIIDIPESVSSLHNLQMLFLSKNQITVIPEFIGSLHNLKYLSLCNNKMTVIPESIGSLHNLQTLNLSENQIKIIPDWISSLHNLRKLDLYNNQITVIPESINLLHNLQELDLSFNQITVIPLTIRDKPYLKIIPLQ